RAAQQRLQARDQFDEREWLREVVVSAGVEAGDPVDERVSGGEEEDGRRDAARAERLAKVASVGVREADVDHERIRSRQVDPIEQLRAARDAFDSEPFFAQAAREDGTELVVVLDDHDRLTVAHSWILIPRAGWRLAASAGSATRRSRRRRGSPRA